MAIELREYLDERGRSPYAEWFEKLDSHAAQKVEVALWRIEAGISPMFAPWAEECWSTKFISARVIASTLAGKAQK